MASLMAIKELTDLSLMVSLMLGDREILGGPIGVRGTECGVPGTECGVRGTECGVPGYRVSWITL